MTYRGRLAPSPTGYLHLGHGRSFWAAWKRARSARGVLVFRNEDLDPDRSQPEFVSAMFEDLRWLGLDWDEGPDVGGPYAAYAQSARRNVYLAALRALARTGHIYPCSCSRKELAQAAQAPHEGEDEPLYPGKCRPRDPKPIELESPAGVNWRFRVPENQKVAFDDGHFGRCEYVAGRDFGDFVVWRRDDVPAYQLAVVADDIAMRITEVVRGEDLLKSTARQILLHSALKALPPVFFHCPLVRDERGQRLAKRHDSLSLRALRAAGTDPAALRSRWEAELDI